MASKNKSQDDIWHDYWKDTPDDPYLEAEASVFATNLIERFELSDTDRVLDFGCGYGYVSEHLATTVSHVYLWDEVAGAMKTALRRINRENVSSVDPSETNERFDLIVVNSVVQYMSETSLSSWLRRWEELLSPDGAIAITDVPEGSPSLLFEAAQWFWLAVRNRVLGDAIRFARKNRGRYQEARRKTGLGTLSEEQLREMAQLAGLDTERQKRNLAYQSHRASYALTRSG